MFPDCCFLQRSYVVQGHVNGVFNEIRNHSCLLVECFSGFISVYIGETTKNIQEFMKKDKIFIPRKYKEKR